VSIRSNAHHVVDPARRRFEGQVGRRAARVDAADLVLEAGAGIEVTPRLMQGDRKHPRLVVEDPLNAVAVVDVDVDVHHSPRRLHLQDACDCDGRVVVDAEARRLAAAGMVQPAGGVERMGHLSRRDELGCSQRRAADRRGGGMHPTEDGIVAGAQPELESCPRRDRAGVDALHRVDEVCIVHRQDLIVGRRRRAHLLDPLAVHEAEAPDVVVSDEHAVGPQRVRRPEVVGLGDVVDDDQGD
jgi:hypothetical protein